MKKKTIRQMTPDQIDAYCGWLAAEEQAPATIAKYRHDLTALCTWLDGQIVTKALLLQRKESMLEDHAPASVNAMLASINGFFRYMGWKDLRMKYLKVQRRIFCEKKRELTREDYMKLIAAAVRLGKERLALVLETICALGLRVSELKFITAEAVQRGEVEIRMKGKSRTITISGKLARKLRKYAQKNKIASGEIFITRSGRSLSRGQIWQEMKQLSEEAGVEPEKVFPHNLRHLFARTYYNAYKDIVKLADVLGHSSVNTTRIYLISTGAEHAWQMEQLGLVS